MGKACKTTAVVLFILGFIGSIIGGVYAESFLIFLYCALGNFLFWLVLYTLGEIAEQLGRANENTYEIIRLLKKITPTDSKPASTRPVISSSAQSSPVKKAADGTWVCKKCSTKNESNAQFCKDCGTYR